jgi:hypothetical protein
LCGYNLFKVQNDDFVDRIGTVKNEILKDLAVLTSEYRQTVQGFADKTMLRRLHPFFLCIPNEIEELY